MAKKNQQTSETVEIVADDKPRMTMQEARAIIADPESTPIQKAHATRRVNAEARAALPPAVRAKADFADFINDAADRIYNGGKGTIFGACGRFSTVSRGGEGAILPAGEQLVSTADLNRGLDYLLSLIDKCRDNIGAVKGDDKTGFAL